MSTRDADLEELATFAVSARQIVIGVLVAIPVTILTLVIVLRTTNDAGWPLFLPVVVGPAIGLLVARRIRTPIERFETLRILRDRPGDVAHIVAIYRGKFLLALTDADGVLLAKPLQLANRFDDPEDAPSPQQHRAFELATLRCPDASVSTIVDKLGTTSLAKLARKATQPELPTAKIVS